MSESTWIPVPDSFKKNIVTGKSYESSDRESAYLIDALRERLPGAAAPAIADPAAEPNARYGNDQGYITVTPDSHILISKRIRQEFENGKDYYALAGQTLKILPERPQDRPSADFLNWHNQNRYLE